MWLSVSVLDCLLLVSLPVCVMSSLLGSNPVTRLHTNTVLVFLRGRSRSILAHTHTHLLLFIRRNIAVIALVGQRHAFMKPVNDPSCVHTGKEPVPFTLTSSSFVPVLVFVNVSSFALCDSDSPVIAVTDANDVV